ncbi:DNA-binding transcriptional regulator, LysR family [Lachnospiraceae bacterium XBB1006]|nr:DNA-binding transcriptional regulator, LysR family [Lachnospiraceae bacterium XBB1006]
MNIQKYHAFLKVAQYKSISKAAADMGYTQSAVSKMIMELEKEWALTLFTRNHDGLAITPDGTALLEDARRLLHDYERLTYTVSALHGLAQGTIRLGAPFSISANILPGALKEFQNHYPNIKIELVEGEDADISNLLHRGEIDLCILPTPLADRYDSVELFSDSLVAAVPMDSTYADTRVFPVKAFSTENTIRLKEIEDYDITNFLEHQKVVPHIAYEVSDVNVMLSMVEKGLGICLDYALLFKPLRYQVLIKPLDKTRHRTLKLCVRNNIAIPPLVDVFRQSLKEYAKTLN